MVLVGEYSKLNIGKR